MNIPKPSPYIFQDSSSGALCEFSAGSLPLLGAMNCLSSSKCALGCTQVSFRNWEVFQSFHVQVVPCTEPQAWLQSSQDRVGIHSYSDILEEKPPRLARSPVEFTEGLGWVVFFFPKKSILNIFHFSKYQLSFPPPFSKAFPLKWITALCLILKFQTESHTQGMASQNSNWKSTWPRQEEAIWMSGYVLEHIRQQPLQNCLSCLSSHTEPHCRDPFPSSLCGNISERVPAMNRDTAPHGGRKESPVPKASG